jgi:hypothetical protein
VTSTAYEKFMSGESNDEAMLRGRPSHKDVAKTIARLVGSMPDVEYGYCAPYAPQTNFILKFRLPKKEQIAEIRVHEDSWPADDPHWYGLATDVTAARDDDIFAILEGLADAFGGWTRRPDRSRNDYGSFRIVTPETKEWIFHSGPEGHDPALEAELALTKLGLGGSEIFPPLSGVMTDRGILDSVIDILTTYRDATKDGTRRMPGSDQKIRHDEMIERRNRASRRGGR